MDISRPYSAIPAIDSLLFVNDGDYLLNAGGSVVYSGKNVFY